MKIMSRNITALFIFTSVLIVCFISSSTGAQQLRSDYQSKKTIFLFVKIPEPLMPLERARKYEDPLNEFLVSKGLGEVSGGGTMLTKEKKIEYIGIDVDVYDPDKATPLIVKKLRELGVPTGTVIEQSEPIKKVTKVK